MYSLRFNYACIDYMYEDDHKIELIEYRIKELDKLRHLDSVIKQAYIDYLQTRADTIENNITRQLD